MLGMSRQAVYVLTRHVMEKLDEIEGSLRFAGNVQKLEARIKELEQENSSLRKKLQRKEANSSK